ncbi:MULTISPECIES: helix-turn-helix domain-containing protein [Leifsonia]|uniref:DNA-binding IclR family transcriptional regulator n=1 Tax=Leifsonia soli TaxID=582665 RepID=A0A852SYU7_9MICO|nr:MULTISPECIES: helix-turn-helix domain-containing protein [Leifsonia]NYD73724.1 DNA-binding IclR family transcriptional regulator [Leifsonia soli]SEA75889.1 DNA-binding transcriptional regulator, IclR family [Leifsonia sp. 21MFCrub1.1]
MNAIPELSGRQPGAVHSAFAVLEEVARAGPGITAQQLSARLGLPRATAYRILNLLVQDEYLVRMPDLRGFALGRKVAELADVAQAQDAAATAREAVAELRARIRGGVHLAVYRDDRVVPVDVDPDFPLSDPKRIGSDLSVSALGRLLLAEQAARAVPSPTRFTTQEGELVPGFGCLAVPVRGGDQRLVAGLALALPAARLADRDGLVSLVADTAVRLGPLLGR